VLLLQDSPADAEHRFGERTLETLLGVGLALFFGAVVPAALRRILVQERSELGSFSLRRARRR
jgi:divalent metal cation (Fe/Co/Zn/Cd) transporter